MSRENNPVRSLLNGSFPNHWIKKHIADLLFFQEGPGVRKNQFTAEGVKLLNVGNINNNELNLDTTSLYVSEEEAFGRYKHFLVDEGDLLIACSGIAVDNFSKKITFVKKEHLPLCMNTSTMRFKVERTDEIDIMFFYRFLQTDYFKDQLRKLITGSAQLNFGPSHIQKIQIPLPPLPEQKHIANVLDKANALVKKNKALLQEYSDLQQAIFLDMFGDPVTNPKGWDIYKLNGLIDNIDSGWSPKCDKKSAGENEWGVLTLSSVTSRIYQDQYNKKLPQNLSPKENIEVRNGDLLFSRKNTKELVGAAAFVFQTKPRLLMSDTIFRINCRNKELSSHYLYYILNGVNFRKEVQKLATGSAGSMPNISKEKLKKLSIPLPPVEFQNEFASIIENIEQQKNKAKESLADSEVLFGSLVQRYFGNGN